MVSRGRERPREVDRRARRRKEAAAAAQGRRRRPPLPRRSRGELLWCDLIFIVVCFFLIYINLLYFPLLSLSSLTLHTKGKGQGPLGVIPVRRDTEVQVHRSPRGSLRLRLSSALGKSSTSSSTLSSTRLFSVIITLQ